MKTFRHHHIILLSMGVLLLFGSFTHKNLRLDARNNGELKIHFSAYSNQSPLIIGKTYSNSFQEKFTIDRFRFYVGGIRLFSGDAGAESGISADDYFLFDLADSASEEITISSKAGTYNGIEFLFGVDSIHNTGGAQAGALDPRRGMFWTWNSGYVILKLEGTSPLSNLPGHAIEYHVGGYRRPNNVSQIVSLAFQKGKELKIESGMKNQVNVHVNVDKLFNGLTSIHINATPSCNTPGPLAKMIADNCKQMFSLDRSIETR
ncbi:MAG: hypothetical protein C5B59_14830 [Bacteroidetes bacterium]|nr:MAG: hypothetical protein C5B59_14830 [Bacteroidota bacterium]